MVDAVKFRAVHSNVAWRGRGHSSFYNALYAPKRSAKALFDRRNEAIERHNYGEPLLAFAWNDEEAYSVRPDGRGNIQVVQIPVELVKSFNEAKRADVSLLEPYFSGARQVVPTAAPLSPMDSSRDYWWVNNKQTFTAEFEGGYIWSPKANKNGARNQTYDNLTLVQPGDVVVSYAGALIRAIGVATGQCKEAPKPEEFGQIGANWSNLGWLVPIEWTALSEPVSPKVHIARIQPLLPEKNSPLQANGNGNQGCYLAAISPELGQVILDLAGRECPDAVEAIEDLEQQAEADAAEQAIQSAEDIPDTEKEQLVRSRRGQGLFRQRVLAIEPRCRLTGVSDQSFLVASHIKPWKDSDNVERLDGHNGLILAPHVDKLFDRGWISFADDGQLLVAEQVIPILAAWGISVASGVGEFSVGQKAYLAYHRAAVFKG